MGKIFLLDCTLRDGGYVNDWKFGRANLISIFERLSDANADIIEVGFLDERRPFDIDRSIMPDTASAEKIYGKARKGRAMTVGMIDFGTCGTDKLQPCSESFLDGIRVIFKKHLMHEAMAFCGQVKTLGYKVFAQLVSITSYNDEELTELAELVNQIKPYGVSMVDTYGLLHPDELLHYYEILDRHVLPQIVIGFHAHNNFQLGYANALAFLSHKTDRDIVVDGTLYGMGKSAGNAPLELLAMRLNDKFGGDYRIDPMLEAIDESIMEFYAKSPWGYKVFFYLCGKNRVHPNYLTYFEGKKNFSLSKADKLMSMIEPEEKKLLYDKAVAESVYKDYMEENSDDISKEAFLKETSGRNILLIGPGKNMHLQLERVQEFIKAYAPYTIAINYIPDEVPIDCVFVTNSTRYHDMTLQMTEEKNSQIRFLATTNVEGRGRKFDFVVNRAPLLETDEKIIDNSFLMLVKLLKGLGIQKIRCAGFDGYSDKEDNYCNPAMEYCFVKQEASHLNRHMKKAIADLRKAMEIEFITYSAYDEVEDINGASI